MDEHPEFLKSLKLSNSKRFDFIPLIFTSHTIPSHEKNADEVIGLWFLDKEKAFCKRHKTVCLFKQDFIVNTKKENKEFISYSSDNDKGIYIKPIKDFFVLYGNNEKFYHDGKCWQHHYQNVENLPEEPRLRKLAVEAKCKLQ